MKYDSITEQSIGTLVERFYATVRRDIALAPIFEKALAGRWDALIGTMRQFWCSALRVKRDYFGDMLAVHQKPGRLPRSLLVRWLVLFRKAVDECFTEAPAETIFDRALKTARNLESALTHSGSKPIPAMRSGAPWPAPRERARATRLCADHERYL
jgi:hemoglobin